MCILDSVLIIILAVSFPEHSSTIRTADSLHNISLHNYSYCTARYILAHISVTLHRLEISNLQEQQFEGCSW